jgi:hypothetical protein
MGVKRYIDQQLHRAHRAARGLAGAAGGLAGAADDACTIVCRLWPAVHRPQRQQGQQQAARQRAARELTPQVHMARLLQATESPRQLEEVMTEFWANHFNVFEGKVGALLGGRLRKERHPSLCTGQLPRPAGCGGASSGHALLPRQLALQRRGTPVREGASRA